jgi:hypothetical protein
MRLYALIPAADRVNILNIALMLISCAVALVIPFELFLFSYAVLGPAHYLTEISWLEKRQFFTRGRYDFLLLVLLAVFVFVSAPPSTEVYTFSAALGTTLALGAALVLVASEKAGPRVLGLVGVFGLALWLLHTFGFLALLMAVFVPTLVHVYVFTGFFMIFGALKAKSLSGYAAFAVFLACPLACWLIKPIQFDPNPFVVVSYWKSFSLLNLAILGIDVPQNRADGGAAGLAVFTSSTGLIVMRFIAFAYTYHYLNWFSKTSIIRWHEAGKRRMVAIAGLWVASVALCFYDYAMSVKVLLGLSLLHVYLEFPLNHLSIVGTFKEIRMRALALVPMRVTQRQ